METIIDERTEVAKHACEADKSFSDRELCSLGKVGICKVVLFSLSLCLRVIVVSGKKCNVLPGRLVGAVFEGSDCTGSVIVKDLGRMQIVLGGQLLAGANSTNFAECCVTGDLSLDRPDP